MLIEYMPQLTLIIVYICIGLFAGFMSGMFGIGGGAVRIPLLNLAGLPLLSAFGINLFIVPFSSLVGAVSQRANIDKEIALYLAVKFELLTEDNVLELLEKKGPTDIILSGREPGARIIEMADIATHMEKVKHYWNETSSTTSGIEY